MSQLNLKGEDDKVIERCDYTQVWFLLYPDDETLNCQAILNNLSSLCNDVNAQYLCAWILHDKDIWPDGRPKKPHYHCVVKMRFGHKTPSAMRKTLGLPADYYMRTFDNFGATLAYLIHFERGEQCGEI